jgi:hypothetical protein
MARIKQAAIRAEAYREPKVALPEAIRRFKNVFGGAKVVNLNEYTLLFYLPSTFNAERDNKIFEGLYSDGIIQNWMFIEAEEPEQETLRRRTMHDIGARVRGGKKLTLDQGTSLLNAYLLMEQQVLVLREELKNTDDKLGSAEYLLSLRNAELTGLFSVLKAVFHIEVVGQGHNEAGEILTRVRRITTGQILGEDPDEMTAIQQGVAAAALLYAKENGQ